MDAFSDLISQIDAFIKKYYKNQMIKGSLFFIGLSLFSFITIVLLEYIGHFSGAVRATFFYTFFLFFISIFIKFLLIPLFKLFSLSKGINRFQAAEIIGTHFPEISDRLLNTLQLQDNLIDHTASYELIRASINQRSKSILHIPILSAINFSTNRVYLKYVIPVVLVFLSILIFYPSLIQQGTKRVVYYNRDFPVEAPFQFVLTDLPSSVDEGKDIPLQLQLRGSKLPDKVYLVSSEGKYLMNKQTKVSHFFVLKRLKKNVTFYFESNGFVSKEYRLSVAPKVTLGKLEAFLDYPDYLGKKDEKIQNAGDLEIPEGTKITWSIFSKNAHLTDVYFNKSKKQFKVEGFTYSQLLKQSSEIHLDLRDSKNSIKDSFTYQLTVVKDAFPSISVSENKDSLSEALRFFSGSIEDDYGISSLSFVYKIVSKNGTSEEFRVPILKSKGTSLPFTHAIDFRRENLSVDDRIEYYFVVRDNDALNGFKATRSSTFTYQLPSLSELNEKRDESQKESLTSLSSLSKQTKEFNQKIDRLKKDLLNTKSPNFNQKNAVEQLKEERNSLENQLQNLQLQMQESLMEKEQLSDMDKELLEKQEMLQELLNEVMDDELKELLDKLQELMEKEDKNAIEKNLDKLDMKSEDMNKQLDRSMEMLKRLQVNEKIDDLTKELKELSKEQSDLQKDLENKKISSEDASKIQEEISKKFDELKEDLNELKKLNEELKKPLDLGNQDEKCNEISNEQKSAKDNLSSNKSKKAQENQKNAAQKMEEMANELEQQQASSNQKQQEEDMDALREILESLMTLSFNQEHVLDKFSLVKDKDPFYKKLGKTQRKIIDDTRIVEDSLNAIAERQPKIASFITKELNDINLNFKYGLENIDEHKRRELLTNLQYVMTSYNNLALLLNESLQQMQQQMQQNLNSSGNGSCNNPGGKGSKPSDSDNEDMKETLKKQLEKMKKGQSAGGSKPGNKEGQNMLGLQNKEIAKMAAQQTAIRQKLEQMRNELNKDGKGSGNKLNPLINELEKQEKDLINKKFSNEMINRQQDILTRMLESEKALKERGFDEKRESKVGKNVFLSNQNRIDEYNKQKLRQIELLRSVDPVFRNYYKNKANEYFNLVQ